MNRSQPFGRYELIDRISAGGMAEVFRARDNERGGTVALKKILPHVAEDEEFIEMFEDEARITSQLEHPHIARTLDFGSIGSSYYIAFEYVRGKDLRAIFERAVKSNTPIPIPFLLYIFARIGEGLSYAHARKDSNGSPVSIVHRDVSPQNIIVSFAGDVKLIDFGIAKAAGKLSRTAVGAIKGKFGYMSPEQVRGLEIDQRTDVFSLGITMWELFTRQRLFSAENELLVLEKIRNLKVPAPSSIDPAIPPGLDDIVLKALAKNPADRYQSAKELYRDLNILAQSTGNAASREDVAAYMVQAFPQSADSTGSYTGPLPGPQEPTPASQSGPRVHPQSPEPGGASRPASPPTGPGLSYNPSSPSSPMGGAGLLEKSMAADKSSADKRSDLDIFEGLGKKGPSGAPPAPPSRGPAPPPPPSELGKKTLLGIAAPAGAPPPPSGRMTPPPVRPSLPAVSAPPSKSAPPAVATRPAPYNAPTPVAGSPSGGMDMDWDDEDEATHIFDKEESQAGPAPTAPKPAAGMPIAAPTAPLPRSSGVPAPPPNAFNRTVAMNHAAPPPPPGRLPSAPPPPPSSVGSSFARASGQVAAPGPVMADPRPLINQQAMTMGAQPQIANLAGQLTTEPLKMPPRPPSAPPPNNYGMPSPMQQQQMQQNNPFMQQQQQMQQQQMQQQQQQPYDMGMNAPAPMPMAPRTMEATALVRPPSSGSKVGVIVAIVVALLVIAGAAAAYVFLFPHTGNIAVNVADAKGGAVSSLEVTLDGRKVCDTAPCRIEQIKAGSHELKVHAQGYDDPAPKLVAVESGRDAQVDFTLASNAAKGTGFKVTGTQPGVKLLVDNNEVGALPQELRDLTPGEHKLKFVGTLKSAKNEDRYAPLEKTVNVTKDEVSDLGSVTLKVLVGKATITLGTPGANVKLVASNGDQRTPTQYPVSIEIDTSKASWSIVATKFGFNEYKQPISFDDGQAEKVYNVQLEAKGAAAPVYAGGGGGGGAVVHSGGGGGGGGGGGHSGGTTTSGEAKLTINAIPVSGTVAILDGKPLGAVPKKDVVVSPGSHTVVFINSEKSLRKSITVNVAAGESKPAFTKLDD